MSENDWFAGSVSAAVHAGILTGYTDGTFRPMAYVSRQEMAAIMVRTLKAEGISYIVDVNKTDLLSSYTDAAAVDSWASDVLIALETGILTELNDGKLGSRDAASRTQAAVALKEFLMISELINRVQD